MDNLNFRPMSDAGIHTWYQEELSAAFLPQERKPLPDILALRAKGRYELWGLYDASQLLGYATIWKAPHIPLVLLDYLGVTARLRCGGLGSHILSLLKAQQRPLVAEAELPIPGGDEAENALRRRRIGFYCRNGFTPAYEMATCGLRWQALLWLPQGVDDSLPALMRWHKALYGTARTDVLVPLPPDMAPPALPYWMQSS